MTRRILGLETEYGILVAGHGGPAPISAEDAVTLMFEGTPNAFRTTNHFLPNGGRLYVDIGAHPEYASAECDRLEDVVAQDRAGEVMVQRLADRAGQVLADRGTPATIHVLKNNTDSHGATFGCHENYSVARDTDFDTLIRAMTVHLVSRILLVGQGYLSTGPDGEVTYLLSSRAEHIVTTASADPTKNRPLLNTKDEAHADRARWRRLHVIAGDSSLAETTSALKVGWTARVLDLVEDGGSLDDLVPEDPIEALRVFNRDITGRATVTTPSGPRSALDLQRELLDRVIGRVGPDPVTDTVGRWLDAIATGDLDALATELDWVLKHRLLTLHTERAGVGWSAPSVARLDLAFHDLSPNTGLGERLRGSGQLATFCAPEQVTAALTRPPATTRAAVRGRFLEWAAARGGMVSVDWGHVRLDRPIRPQIDLPDPFDPTSAKVDELIAELS